ncbi:MAG: NAD(+) synthase [Deltaproteobacteria bacterium]|nr:NAD(+) synthase [Deltaproteobacteria bacterium]
MMRGFARVAAAVPRCGVTDFDNNRRATLELWQRADEEGCAVVVFPELGLSSYTARDLFFDRHLLDSCERVLLELSAAGRDLAPMAIVGLPLRVGDALYNVAAMLQGGEVLGIVPKTYLPNHREFEERRWFRPGSEVTSGASIHLAGQEIPFGTDVLFRAEAVPDFVVGVELCEDFCTQLPPSAYQVSAGATVICNLSASNFTIGKAELRRLLARSASDRGKCAYVYVAAGPGESSTDLAFDADAFICENGQVLVESKRFSRDNQLVVIDVDLESLIHERLVTTSFGDCAAQHRGDWREVAFEAAAEVDSELRRKVTPHPFLPAESATLATRCWETFEIQTHALVTRLQATGLDTLVLGVSGGLDSTHAALVSAAALDQLGVSRENLICVTMPGLGTSASTRENAERLIVALGAEMKEIPVSEASLLVLADIGHPAAEALDSVEDLLERLREEPDLGDVTLENVQARLRTLLLMSLANMHGGLVVGTGDLSEKALGWATYAGDQISMYDVNAGVPKTLIQFVIRWVANERVASWSQTSGEVLRETLFSILDTPISPELLPADAAGEISQLTEDTIGPYELHDFFLYHLVRHGARPTRVLDLATVAFAGSYPREVLKRWFGVFVRRFFSNQFKRSCTADGPKVGMVALSPRGDWRMPSDARFRSWLEEIESY